MLHYTVAFLFIWEDKLATQYPTEREESGDEIRRLEERIRILEEEKRALNLAWMRESAKASEAREELKRCKLEWEIVADQSGHNLCPHAVARALKATIGHTGKYPDPNNVNGEQFAYGCVDYQASLYPDCEFRLEVINTVRIK